MKILAIDYGHKRLGFAVGSTDLRVAVPLCQIENRNRQQSLAFISQLLADHEIDKIVLGYPTNLDGSACATGRRVREFRQLLIRTLGLTVELVDERLSSFAAEESLKEIKNDFRKRKPLLDSVSAQLILQNYFGGL